VSSESIESRRVVGRSAYGLFEDAEATLGDDRGTQPSMLPRRITALADRLATLV